MTVFGFGESSPDGIMIIPTDGYDFYDSFDNPFNGNIDILIYKDDYEDHVITTNINQVFIDTYGSSSNVEHLNHTDWISYTAFYKDASVMVIDHSILYWFAHQIKEQYLSIDKIKIIYFGDDGHTIFTSDEIEIIHPNSFQSRHGEISYNTELNTVRNTYTLGLSFNYFIPFLILRYIGLPLLVIIAIYYLGKFILKRVKPQF